VIALITGSLGLLGQSCVKVFRRAGLEVIGIDNNARSKYFGTAPRENGEDHQLYRADITRHGLVKEIFERYGTEIAAVIHCAAQPSHDWSARQPVDDFQINALATVNLLEQTRQYCPEAVFVNTSTSKVYGDSVNMLRFWELDSRYEPASDNEYHRGINEYESIDQSTHSPFGASKLAGDLMAQEYGRYYGLKTGIFRPGCITGAAHQGAELHGFLSYLVKCAKEQKTYNVYGYSGKQVRDNIHADDLAEAYLEFYMNPKPGDVYNIGGGRENSISILEAKKELEVRGMNLDLEIIHAPRRADHKWYITDYSKFKNDYPKWKITKGIAEIFKEMIG